MKFDIIHFIVDEQLEYCTITRDRLFRLKDVNWRELHYNKKIMKFIKRSIF